MVIFTVDSRPVARLHPAAPHAADITYIHLTQPQAHELAAALSSSPTEAPQ